MRSLYILVLGLFLSIQSFATIPQLLVKSPSANSTVPLYFGNPPASSFPFQGRKDAYLAFTFNIPVVVKSTFEGGAIAIKNYDTDAHIAWGNLDKAIISGNTVYVPLSYGSNIETTLPVGQMFYVTVSANTFADASNPTHLYPGSASENFWRMTRRTNDGNGPTPVSYSPALGQQDAPITREFSITFDEPVLYNYNQHSTGAGVAVAPSGSPGYRADVTITMSADYRTINFKGDPGLFLSKGTDYYFTILEGKVFDVDGNYFSITNPATWTFKTFDAFNPTNFSPAKNTSNLPQDQVFTVTMNNDLDISTWIPHDPSTGLGTGIALRRAYDDYLQEYVFVSSDQVEVNGNILSVRFTNAQPLTTYYISTGTNVIRDAYGQFFDSGTTWRFSTGAATNNAPINITLSASSITENNAVNAVIGTLSSTDPDAGNTFTYSLVAGTGSTNNGSFNINGSQLRASQVFDYETKGTYSIRIRTTDQGGLFFDKMFTITINDATENNSPIDLVPTKTNISENNSVNDLVGNLNTVDPDGSGSFTYALVAGAGSTDNASFNINGNQLRASVVFDYESKSSYNIRLRTTDAGGLSFEKPFTITINNTNETPTDITLSASSINENNSVNAVIATISTTDSDIGNTFTYILAFGEGDDDNASFNLNGSQLRANAAFNYEAKNSYSIRLLTTDNTSRQFSKQFTISIKDVNEAPFNIALSGSSIDENQPANTTIGSLSASDPDLGNTFTYTLVSGAGSEDNASFNINGTQLRSGQTFDFESKSSYAVRIRATDQTGLFFEKQFTVTVNDVSEDTSAPAIISLSPINGGQGVSVPYGSMAVITFDEPVKKASPGFVKLYRKQAGGDVEILNY
ncbi:MAG: cadherin domain-containing protein, partial [Fulvivirga sp.]